MISIVTPVLNEEESIEPFLSHHRNLAGEFELILVDGGSSDRTLAEVERCRGGFPRPLKVIVSERGRAVQMNRGVQEAEGDILLFLHVDCRIPADSLLRIRETLKADGAIGGAFRHSFRSRDLLLRTESAVWNRLVRVTPMYFGDFGIFMRKDVFLSLGGYDPLPFMEDLELCRRARRRGRLVQLDRYISVSPRRYLQKGKYALTAVYLLAILLNALGVRPAFLVRYVVEK
ncbi:MAG: TIGR04283 family arsenosugar biosynthesis glycosyltransferase [Methanomicrobiales archaeon]|nr:TIGR04283 family arsenosugar biosynthesis glycosyltransferase [Methanomicrobiales archaeon]MDI6876762.1 TIGR04283 family arsenosugar biosynthesis glycosyltransferase [Methanomicrobiales archaeon]